MATVYLIVSTPAVTPVTTPPRTVAVVLLLLHVPPGAKSVNVTDEPVQTVEGPVMAPSSGNGFTVTAFVAFVMPHAFVIVYLMVSTPADIPVTMPPIGMPLTVPPITVACALLALQVPPFVLSVNIIEDPTHTLDGPVMLSTICSVSTLTIFIAVSVPHKLVTAYIIVSIPAEIPVTTPPTTIARALLLVHVPPVVVSVNVMIEATHTLEGPCIIPA